MSASSLHTDTRAQINITPTALKLCNAEERNHSRCLQQYRHLINPRRVVSVATFHSGLRVLMDFSGIVYIYTCIVYTCTCMLWSLVDMCYTGAPNRCNPPEFWKGG